MERPFVTVKGLMLCAAVLISLCAARLVRAEDRSPAEMVALGRRLRDGDGCEKNPQKAERLFREAADLGDATALYNLGVCLEHGLGCDKNLEEAVMWYRRAAEQGHEGAKAALQRLRNPKPPAPGGAEMTA